MVFVVDQLDTCARRVVLFEPGAPLLRGAEVELLKFRHVISRSSGAFISSISTVRGYMCQLRKSSRYLPDALAESFAFTINYFPSSSIQNRELGIQISSKLAEFRSARGYSIRQSAGHVCATDSFEFGSLSIAAFRVCLGLLAIGIPLSRGYILSPTLRA